MRSVVFANNEVYHVYNRAVEKRPVFTDKREYQRSILALDYYRFQKPAYSLAKALQLEKDQRIDFLSKLKKEGKKLAEIVSYCLMPNHFHLLLKQKETGGISKYINNFANSYTRYFNVKHSRNGPLFQGVFKAVRMEDEEQLLHVSRYIHLNPVTSYLVKEEDLEKYLWSSLPEYLGLRSEEICDKEIILSNFASKESYRKFVYDQIDYAKKIEAIKHLVYD